MMLQTIGEKEKNSLLSEKIIRHRFAAGTHF